MADLTSFKSKIGGGIRPNQFRVQIRTAGQGVELADSTFEFLCHASSLPGSTIGQAQVFHRGRGIPLAGDRTFAPWTVTVYADQDMVIRDKFEMWSDLMNTYATASGQTNPEAYKGEALVSLLDRSGDQAIYSYIMQGIFPLDISDIQLSWQANDVVGEFSVTFAIEKWESVAGALNQ
jgi:hypothetical protein